ncbi:hypothetical protein P175DRAFT_0537326 [Aspergillus ochraceoroseus IBT 24754]|uniref:Uncharacterized protein n=1 Tax=Aspergillus ochraceoroseus IBT 24754 TaxID=1392256 RepID=A0A2T5M5U0_9EURO|nr:uncharacterized protein P175DRAFT_0537326 [Aspergillus ochraceoroseus IBT 24754]PTU23898.1 hypothetical protein P175DRAFT_0537326 [Aspergillus ochraceoroseus IBT 24754]
MTKPKLKDHHHHHHLLPQNDESESESHHPKLDPESHRQSPSKSKAPKSTPSILHLTLLTTCTLLLLTFAILIIGPSRLLPALDITECAVTPDATNPHLRVYADIPDLERIPGSAPHQQEHGHGHGYEPRTWESMLIPPSGGGIRILPETIADPSPEFPAPNTTHKFGHGIAMFHQLHCLIVLRGVVFPEEGANSTRSTSHHGHGHGGALRGDLEHWAHCFDYIAQVFLSLSLSFSLSYVCGCGFWVDCVGEANRLFGRP